MALIGGSPVTPAHKGYDMSGTTRQPSHTREPIDTQAKVTLEKSKLTIYPFMYSPIDGRLVKQSDTLPSQSQLRAIKKGRVRRKKMDFLYKQTKKTRIKRTPAIPNINLSQAPQTALSPTDSAIRLPSKLATSSKVGLVKRSLLLLAITNQTNALTLDGSDYFDYSAENGSSEITSPLVLQDTCSKVASANELTETYEDYLVEQMHLEKAEGYKGKDEIKYVRELKAAMLYDNAEAYVSLADFIVSKSDGDANYAFQLYSYAADKGLGEGWFGKATLLDNNQKIKAALKPTEQDILVAYKKARTYYCEAASDWFRENMARVQKQVNRHLQQADEYHNNKDYISEQTILKQAVALGSKDARRRAFGLILSGQVDQYKDIPVVVKKVSLLVTSGDSRALTILKDWKQSCRAQIAPNCMSVEHTRAAKVATVIPEVFSRYDEIDCKVITALQNATNPEQLETSLVGLAKELWQLAKQDVQNSAADDRAIYWQRLKMLDSVRDSFNPIVTNAQKLNLMQAMEASSRGLNDISFAKETQIKILLTGFDPFDFESVITSANPSGLLALALDGLKFEVDGTKAEVQCAIFPVRFDDFDQGIVESAFEPLYRDKSVDFVMTTSQDGFDHFTFECFTGLNRSGALLDNENMASGSTDSTTALPFLNGEPLNAPEFLESSLPIEEMVKVNGPWSVKVNHIVITKEKGEMHVNSLNGLTNLTSVEGSGGGFLSNELPHRMLNLKKKYNSSIPTGHLHVPEHVSPSAKNGFVSQVKSMLETAILTMKREQ